MARRRGQRWTLQTKLFVGVVAFIVAWGLLIVALQHFGAALVVLALTGGGWYWWRSRQRAALEREIKAREEAWEEHRRAWRELTFADGPYSVIVSGFEDDGAQEDVTDFLCDVSGWRDRGIEEIEELVQRIVHIAPQPAVEGIALKNAIEVKEELKLLGAKVKIKDMAPRNGSPGRREPIAAAVRREVWQRDGGKCVDCGSRARLEYDHIIAVANGGSNTARNIELRCEKCNRSKGAKV